MAFVQNVPDSLSAGAEAAGAFFQGRREKQLTDEQRKQAQAELARRSSAQKFSQDQSTQQFQREGQWRTEDVDYRNKQARLDNFYRKADELRAEHRDVREGKQFQLEQQLREKQITEQQMTNELRKIDLHYATALKGLEVQAKHMGLQLDQANLGLIGAETARAYREPTRRADYGQLVTQLSPAGRKFFGSMHLGKVDPTQALLKMQGTPGLNASDQQVLPELFSSAEYSKYAPKEPVEKPNPEYMLQWAAVRSRTTVQALNPVLLGKLYMGIKSGGYQQTVSELTDIAVNNKPQQGMSVDEAASILKALGIKL